MPIRQSRSPGAEASPAAWQPASSSQTGVVQGAPAAAAPAGTLALGRVSVFGTSASVRVSCTGAPGATCKITAALSVTETVRAGKVIAITASEDKPKKRIVVLGTARVTLAAGQSKTLKISLNTTVKRLLTARHKLKVKVTITATSAAKTVQVATKTITFKVKPKKQKHH
jgi:hypothetical protein